MSDSPTKLDGLCALVTRDRRAQGLRPKVTDPQVLRRLALLLAPTEAAPHCAASRARA